VSQLPAFVRDYIEEKAAGVPAALLKAAAGRLSDTYRAGGATADAGPLDARTAAYLAVRLPATFAAARHVFAEIENRLAEPATLLDLGAGCGAATLAALESWPAVQSTLLEQDTALIAAGRGLLPAATWRQARIESVTLPAADIVVASYSLGELSLAHREATLARAWAAARLALVLIEPGSMAGFHLITKARAHLLEFGALTAAPCPHDSACPQPADDWCHFAARLERSALHRRLKDATLSYEDEKFSYAVLAKQAIARPAARIIARPVQSPGLIQLTTCAADGLERLRATKRDKAAFRQARKATWGGTWEAPMLRSSEPL
jgi:ribosomal protein RSM22 (predicted rRNA methylase)